MQCALKIFDTCVEGLFQAILGFRPYLDLLGILILNIQSKRLHIRTVQLEVAVPLFHNVDDQLHIPKF